MELSLVGNCGGLINRGVLVFPGDVRKFWDNKSVSFPQRCDCPRGCLKSVVKASQRAVITEPIRSSVAAKSESIERVRLFVGLPLDAVSDCQTVNHGRAIAAGLKALKLLGVEGVEIPVWWGISEKESMSEFDWSGYLAIAEMVREAGLKLHVTLCFHASDSPKIKLPNWVSKIGESQPDIYFKDRSGRHYKNTLSLAVDELPLLEGKTPLQVYRGFCESFKSAFSSFMDSTITGITIGLGPEGDLRYPSHHKAKNENEATGVGEFQCYDKHMLARLKLQAEAVGNPLWGLGGPHDAPRHDQTPTSANFFKDHGGSWDTDYGKFFLSWYSGDLVAHADRVLSMASDVFKEFSCAVYGKIPLMHAYYDTRSRASELTAGFFNADNNDGYDAVAAVFARHSCKMIIPGMDLRGEAPERLLAQIRSSCTKHGVEIAGRNTSLSKNGLEQISTSLSGVTVTDLFMYQRMGAEFFSPEHFPAFTQFVRSLSQPEMHADDLPQGKQEGVVPSKIGSSTEAQMQVA